VTSELGYCNKAIKQLLESSELTSGISNSQSTTHIALSNRTAQSSSHQTRPPKAASRIWNEQSTLPTPEPYRDETTKRIHDTQMRHRNAEYEKERTWRKRKNLRDRARYSYGRIRLTPTARRGPRSPSTPWGEPRWRRRRPWPSTWLEPIRIPRATDQAEEGGGWGPWRRVRQADVAGGEVALGFGRVGLVFLRNIVGPNMFGGYSCGDGVWCAGLCHWHLGPSDSDGKDLVLGPTDRCVQVFVGPTVQWAQWICIFTERTYQSTAKLEVLLSQDEPFFFETKALY
jgi:hypothetical protein